MWLRILIPGQKNPLRLADISRCSLVKDIKEKIKDSQRKRIDNFDLIFSGKLLNDTFSLFDYGVNVNDPLQLITIPSTGEHNTSTSCEPCAKVSKIDSSIFGAKPNDCTERQQSANYKIGDIVDVREVLLGAWFEAQIKNIVLIQSFNNDLPLGSESLSDADFYFKIKYLDEPDSDELTITSTNMRFRSAIRIDIDQLELNKKYLVNYNIDRPELRGHWYDGQITSIKLLKEREEPGENDYEIKATIFLMEHESPIKDCTLKIQEFFEIESKTRNPGLNDSPENCRIYKPDCDDCLDAG
ncbi:MAG: ubiquitin-like with PHD and RING finger domains 2, partial [Marteilia pararefringens]